MQDSQQKILVSTDVRGVATVTINNPDKHNAFDDQIIAELTSAFKELENDPTVRCVILASIGKSFSAGGDLNWMKRMASYSYEENLVDARALAELMRCLNFMSKPTIARVQGAAMGGAVGLVSCCDIAVGSHRARFCLSEVKVGLLPATISPYVIAAIGERAARRYFNTAESFSAERAQDLNLLSSVVDEDDLDSEVNRFVEALLGNGSQAVTASKQLIFEVADREIDADLIEHTSQVIAKTRVSVEGQEGLAAFLEKRPPSWQSADTNPTNDQK